MSSIDFPITEKIISEHLEIENEPAINRRLYELALQRFEGYLDKQNLELGYTREILLRDVFDLIYKNPGISYLVVLINENSNFILDVRGQTDDIKSLIGQSNIKFNSVENSIDSIEDNLVKLNQRLDGLIELVGELKGEIQGIINERVPPDLGVKIYSIPNVKTFWGGVLGGVVAGVGAIGMTLLLLNSRITDTKSDVRDVKSSLESHINAVKTDLSSSDQEIKDILRDLKLDLKRIDIGTPDS